MALQLINIDSFPTYIAASTDIVGGKIVGHPILIGKTIFLTDSGAWKIIIAGDGTVVDFKYPGTV